MSTSKQIIARHLAARAGDSIPPAPKELDVLVDMLAHNETAPLGCKVSAKEALEAMRAAGAISVRSIARVNDICRKYLGRKGFYVK